MKDNILMLDRIFTMSKIPFRYFNLTNMAVISQYGYDTTSDPILADPALRQYLIRELLRNSRPALLYENALLLYAALKTDDESCIMIGPVAPVKVDADSIKKYARLHNLKSDGFHISHASFPDLLAMISILYNLSTGIQLSDEDILANSNIQTSIPEYQVYPYQKYILDNSEAEVLRMNYAEEVRFVKQVRDGDVDGIKAGLRSLQNAHTCKIGKLANNTFKHYEYMVCTALALMSRAAIEGGLNPLIAYAMSDTYLQKLEQAKTIHDMLHLHSDIRLSYAQQVKQSQIERSQISYIEACKNFISRNLNKPIKVAGIAKEIGINNSYLARRFSQKEGVSIVHYIHQMRVEAASNMLKYSNKSITEIAVYLCFPSQSHFGKIFKDHTGMSPQKYRNQEKLADFKE